MISRGTSISLPSLHLGSHSRASFDTGSESIQDPKCSKRKGAPRKLRTKSPLESRSMKSKATSASTKGQRPRSRQRQSSTRNTSYCRMFRINNVSCSQAVLGDGEMFTVAQPFTASNFVSPSTSNVVFNYEVGSAMAPGSVYIILGLMALEVECNPADPSACCCKSCCPHSCSKIRSSLSNRWFVNKTNIQAWQCTSIGNAST